MRRFGYLPVERERDLLETHDRVDASLKRESF
jgi:hypothetical protein